MLANASGKHMVLAAIPKNKAMFGNPTQANEFPYWGFFSREKLRESRGKLLMMDVDFGRKCSLKCPSCFRKMSLLDEKEKGDLNSQELTDTILQAKELGLESIKICGAGEPFENRGIFELLRRMTINGIGAAIFTHGAVLGSDEWVRKQFGHLGFSNALEFCKELKSMKVSIMLNFDSVSPSLQDKLVGNVANYAALRDNALANLVSAGFTDSSPTRLAVVDSPLTRENYGEAYSVYKFARERNIYPVVCYMMTSGKQIDSAFLAKEDIPSEKKISLWTKIYSYNIRNGIQTLQQIENEGISALAGTHPCNQVASGMYLTARGVVTLCPGFTVTFGNVRQETVEEIWAKVQEFWNSISKGAYGDNFNCHCPPKDGVTIPQQLYHEVLSRLREKFGNG